MPAFAPCSPAGCAEWRWAQLYDPGPRPPFIAHAPRTPSLSPYTHLPNQAREDMPILPDTHNKNSPLPHHHEQHAQHHSAGEEHKP